MRGLVGDPSRIAPGLYRRLVRRAQVDGLLADHLVQGEPYLAPDALVLSPDDDQQLRALTERFSRAFDRSARILAPDTADLVELGFPWPAAELLSAETPRLPLVGRFDFVRDRRGNWQLLEFNADTPSGIREAVAVEHALVSLLPGAGAFERPSAGLGHALVDAFVRAVEGCPDGAALGLLTDASELEDLAQMAFTQRLVEAALAARGVSVRLGALDNVRSVRGNLQLAGARLGALYRYVAFESIFGTPAFAAIFDAVAGGRLRLLNGLYGLLLQNKALLAWVWSHRDAGLFPPDERAAIVGHLPPTWRIGDVPSRPGDPGVVVKQVFGREGEEVAFGDGLDRSAWNALRARRFYVVQERVELPALEVVVPALRGARRERGFATVGSFAVEGRWAGYYTRFGGKIITSRAKWLATLVDRKVKEISDGQRPIQRPGEGE